MKHALPAEPTRAVTLGHGRGAAWNFVLRPRAIEERQQFHPANASHDQHATRRHYDLRHGYAIRQTRRVEQLSKLFRLRAFDGEIELFVDDVQVSAKNGREI